jgi:hypothetical protein
MNTLDMITLDEANRLLSSDHFPDKDLKRFPFGDLLCRLWTRDDEDGKEYREHAPRVLKAMNRLLSRDPGSVMCSDPVKKDADLLEETKNVVGKSFERFDSSAQALFRIATLYHDIGKYIIKERHPTVGWYTLEYIDPNQKDALRSLVGGRDDYLQLLMILIRDHDQFGVLCTGEASYPILLRAATSLGSNPDDQKRIISAMMWLNLADMAGTPGLELQSDDVDKLVNDWKWTIETLDTSIEKGLSFDAFVIEKASSEDLVERRICRLLLESSRNAPKRLEELTRRVSNEPFVTQLVRNQLRTVYPTRIPRQQFCSQYTHVCKLDYGKRFFSALVEYCEGEPKSGEQRSLPLWAEKRVATTDLVYAVLAILRRITSTYSAMVNAENGLGNLIGVEMKDLTPRNAPEKTARIIDLLLRSHYPGLSWMMSDVPAWYF